jgi:hypothetical protein
MLSQSHYGVQRGDSVVTLVALLRLSTAGARNPQRQAVTGRC